MARGAAVALLASVALLVVSVALLVVGLGASSPQVCVAAIVIGAVASLIASLVHIRRAGREIACLVLGLGAVLLGILLAMGVSDVCLWVRQLKVALIALVPLLLFVVTGLIALIGLAVDRRVEHRTGLLWIPGAALVSVTCASLVFGTFAGAYVHESSISAGLRAGRGPFTATGSMSGARADHTATLLLDGRVLVAGGEYVASAELYDPKTGTFSPTGSMTTHRGGSHTATLLSDGRVLVAGGCTDWDCEGGLSSAELYDPTVGTFSPTGSMSASRNFHTATLLSDGRVLIAGGGYSSAELYDPKTGTFSPTGSMSTYRAHDTATLLQDGRVLVAGGGDIHGSVSLDSAELYDPKTGTFSQTGSMTSVRWNHTTTLFSDGRVLIAGGCTDWDCEGGLSSAELYDPTTGKFTATGSMATARHNHTATLLLDGRVLVAGGGDSPYPLDSTESTELYDPKTGTFSATGSMTTAHSDHTATLLPDGRVLIAGGYYSSACSWSDAIPLSNSAELYQP